MDGMIFAINIFMIKGFSLFPSSSLLRVMLSDRFELKKQEPRYRMAWRIQSLAEFIRARGEIYL